MKRHIAKFDQRSGRKPELDESPQKTLNKTVDKSIKSRLVLSCGAKFFQICR